MGADGMFDPLEPDAGDSVVDEEKFQPMIPLAGREKEKIHHFELGKPSHIWPYYNWSCAQSGR